VTDVSDPRAAGPPPLPEGPAETVLARGHLHPAILLLRLLDAMRQVAVPLLLGVVLERWLLVVAIGLFVVHLGYALARYLTLEYTLTAEELRVREGLLERQERRIPLDRIQDLGFESTILRRALGLVVVLVETASGRGVEARLDALSRADADHLREVLLSARAHAPSAAPVDDEATPTATPEATPEWLLHRSSAGELVLRGLTDLRLSAFVVTGFAVLELADQLGFAVRLRGLAAGFRSWLAELPPTTTMLVLGGMLFVVIAFGVVTTTLGNLVQFHGFTLLLRGDALQRRYGLLTTRQKTLPRARVQRVTFEQNWLRRLTGHCVAKADSAGGSRSDGQDTTGGWDVVVPLTRLDTAHGLLPALLPGVERTTFEWHRGSPRLVLRTALQGVVFAALASPFVWWHLGALPALGIAAGLVAVFSLLGSLAWRNLAWAAGDEHFALQHGIVGRTYACVPTAKVQAVVVRQSPLSQALGLADLTVYVAGGSPTRLPDLVIADARRLARQLAGRAAPAAAADW
jgi:putative membrane protein